MKKVLIWYDKHRDMIWDVTYPELRKRAFLKIHTEKKESGYYSDLDSVDKPRCESEMREEAGHRIRRVRAQGLGRHQERACGIEKDRRDRGGVLKISVISDRNSTVEFDKNTDIQFAIQKVQNMIDDYGHRTVSIDDKGYDTKFASHLIRLLSEGIELVRDQRITLPRPEAAHLLDIRNGKVSIEDVEKEADELKKELESIGPGKLPDRPDRDRIERIQMDILGRRLIRGLSVSA